MASASSTASARKGQSIGVDFAIALGIFLITVATGIYYATTILLPANPFGSQVQASASQAVDEFHDQNSWTVLETPIAISSSTSLDNYPIELDLQYPDDLDTNSTLVMRGSQEIASQTDYSQNDTIWLVNLSQGQNRHRLVYTTDTDLADRQYDDRVHRSGDDIWNDEINITFDSDGIDNLTFDDTEDLLIESDLDASDGNRKYVNGSLRVLARYNDTDQKKIRVFGLTNHIRLFHNLSGDAVYHFNLSSSFDTLHVSDGDQTITMDENGTYYHDTTDTADFSYTDSGTTFGLSLMSEEMELFVHRNETGGQLWVNATVSATDGKDTLLLPHFGDHTAVTAERSLFLTPPSINVSLTQRREGLSRDEMADFEAQNDDQIAADLGLQDLGFNITINDTFNAGEDIPGGQEISALEHPAAILDRWANTTVKTLKLRTWF
jgi:hypothetical protein